MTKRSARWCKIAGGATTVVRLLGLSGPNLTLRHYNHRRATRKRQATLKIFGYPGRWCNRDVTPAATRSTMEPAALQTLTRHMVGEDRIVRTECAHSKRLRKMILDAGACCTRPPR